MIDPNDMLHTWPLREPGFRSASFNTAQELGLAAHRIRWIAAVGPHRFIEPEPVVEDGSPERHIGAEYFLSLDWTFRQVPEAVLEGEVSLVCQHPFLRRSVEQQIDSSTEQFVFETLVQILRPGA